MPALRAKSEKLTGYLEFLVDRLRTVGSRSSPRATRLAEAASCRSG